MTGQEAGHNAAATARPDHLIARILTFQLGLGVAVAMLFWGAGGLVPGYSALLGAMTCVLPNAFLALRLSAPRQDDNAKSLMRAAYVGEIGKIALTVIMFIVIFSLVRPLEVGALFAGFIVAQLATFAGFLNRSRAEEQQLELKSNTNGE